MSIVGTAWIAWYEVLFSRRSVERECLGKLHMAIQEAIPHARVKGLENEGVDARGINPVRLVIEIHETWKIPLHAVCKV